MEASSYLGFQESHLRSAKSIIPTYDNIYAWNLQRTGAHVFVHKNEMHTFLISNGENILIYQKITTRQHPQKKKHKKGCNGIEELYQRQQQITW